MKINRSLVFAVLWLLVASVSAAESNPRSQPIQLEADHVMIDDLKRVSTYSGNVRLSQGGIRISADKITVYGDKQRVLRMVAEGSPVSITQERPAGGDLRGTAARVEYRVVEQTALLTGNAELWQGTSQFSSARIELSLKEGLLKAAGEKKGQDRVRVVIQPEMLEEKKGESKP